MSLEARVDALEHEMAVLRAETRGWAAFAISADRKAGAASELLTLIHQDVNDVKAEVGAIRSEHGQILASHTQTLDGHTEILNGHTETLNEHGQMLREILSRLA
jgi:hypothetical protein